MSKNIRLGIVGFGNMGGALAKALRHNKTYKICVYDFVAAKTSNRGFCVCPDSLALVANSDVVILAIKPQDIPHFVEAQKYSLAKKPLLLISIAAGLPTGFYEKKLNKIKVVRVMPNLAAQVGESVSFVCKGRFATTADLAVAKNIFSAVGSVFTAPESFFDKVTSICGSGPGYVFYIMDAVFAAALSQGFDRKTARRMVIDTFSGAVKLAKNSQKDFSDLTRSVTSKKGTTAAAIEVFDRNALAKIIKQGIEAARRRGEAIANSY